MPERDDPPNSTPSSISPVVVSPAVPYATRPDPRPSSQGASAANTAVTNPVSTSAAPSAPRASPRAPTLAATESHTRTLTSADRSTVYSPAQRTAAWQAQAGRQHVTSIKPEDDPGAPFNAAPGISPTSPLVAYGQGHAQQYHYPQTFQDQTTYQAQTSAYYAQEPSSLAISQQGAYQPPAGYAYHAQTAYSRAPDGSISFQQQQSQSQQPHNPYLPRTNPHPKGCECGACAAGSMGGRHAPLQPPALELASKSGLQGWNAEQPSISDRASGMIPSSEWPKGTHQGTAGGTATGRYSSWGGDMSPLDQVQSQPQSSHVAMQQHVPSASFPPERGAYMNEAAAKWTGNASFDYEQPPQPSTYSGPTGPTSSEMSTSPTSNWSIPSSSQHAGGEQPSPTSSGQPPSPTYPRTTGKTPKHKSRKTWTETEWKKLTDLAERSKRGNPEADIDWDFVTSGFGGRRCRQGILTVAAKRGLKVSTREARTIGKQRARSNDEFDGHGAGAA